MAVLLIPVEKVKARMVMPPEMLGVNPVIESAILAAQMRIESELDTGLQPSDNVDTFYINPEWFGGVVPSGNMWRLFLKNGFVDQTTPVVVESCSTLGGDYSPVTEDLRIDPDKGVVYLDARRYQNQYIRVTYKAGFSDASAVPAWLGEAILGYTPLLFKLGPAADSKKGELYKESAEHAQAMLARHQRNVGLVFRTLF